MTEYRPTQEIAFPGSTTLTEFIKTGAQKIRLYGVPIPKGNRVAVVYLDGQLCAFSPTGQILVAEDKSKFASFVEKDSVSKFLDPRLQAIVRSFHESEEFQKIRDLLPPGQMKGGALFGKWQQQKIFVPVEATALWETIDGHIIKLFLNSEYMEGFRSERLGIIPVMEYWVVDLDPSDEDSVSEFGEELKELGSLISVDCALHSDSGFSVDGIMFRSDDILNPTRISNE